MNKVKILKFTITDKVDVKGLSKLQKFICRVFRIPEPDPEFNIEATIEVDGKSIVGPNCMYLDEHGQRWFSLSNYYSMTKDSNFIKIKNTKPIINLRKPTELAFIASVYKENSSKI